MPLSAALPGLKTALAAAFGKGEAGDTDAEDNIQAMADDVGDAIHAYVTAGLVATVVTIPVTAAAGSPSAGTGTGAIT